jgi:3-methylfumaryl-CoA hydratase
MNEEGYPGLIVHGPLLATLLAELVRRNASRPMRSFAFRASAPIFDTAPFRVLGEPQDDNVKLTAIRCDGATAMQAEARLG